MVINVKRCYFHSIQPLINYNARKEYLEEQLARLNFMLDYGYLVPGREINDILPEEYQEKTALALCGHDSVYLAQHPQTELPSVGGSYFNGEFSAYFEHISGYPSLVFNEFVIENKQIEFRGHSLSEEVCIQDRISLEELIALALPYPTPLSKISNFISSYEEAEEFGFYDFLVSFLKEDVQETMRIITSPRNSIEESYKIIKKFEDCLKVHQKEIPCIHQDGSKFNKQEELEYVRENSEKVLRMIKVLDNK